MLFIHVPLLQYHFIFIIPNCAVLTIPQPSTVEHEYTTDPPPDLKGKGKGKDKGKDKEKDKGKGKEKGKEKVAEDYPDSYEKEVRGNYLADNAECEENPCCIMSIWFLTCGVDDGAPYSGDYSTIGLSTRSSRDLQTCGPRGIQSVNKRRP